MKKLYGVWFKNNYEPLAMLDIKLTDKTIIAYSIFGFLFIGLFDFKGLK